MPHKARDRARAAEDGVQQRGGVDAPAGVLEGGTGGGLGALEVHELPAGGAGAGAREGRHGVAGQGAVVGVGAGAGVIDGGAVGRVFKVVNQHRRGDRHHHASFQGFPPCFHGGYRRAAGEVQRHLAARFTTELHCDFVTRHDQLLRNNDTRRANELERNDGARDVAAKDRLEICRYLRLAWPADDLPVRRIALRRLALKTTRLAMTLIDRPEESDLVPTAGSENPNTGSENPNRSGAGGSRDRLQFLFRAT